MGWQSWLVGIIGVVIAGLVLLAFFKLNIQAQERSISATQQRAVRTNEMDLLSMIEIDFQNIGSNFYAPYDYPPADSAIFPIEYVSPDSVFKFIGQTDPNEAPKVIEYRWREIGTLQTQAGSVPTYQINRFVDGNLSGMSSGAVTGFQIEFLDFEGSYLAPASIQEETRQLRVKLSMASNLGESSHVGATQYEFVVRPHALARNDYERYTDP